MPPKKPAPATNNNAGEVNDRASYSQCEKALKDRARAQRAERTGRNRNAPRRNNSCSRSRSGNRKTERDCGEDLDTSVYYATQETLRSEEDNNSSALSATIHSDSPPSPNTPSMTSTQLSGDSQEILPSNQLILQNQEEILGRSAAASDYTQDPASNMETPAQAVVTLQFGELSDLLDNKLRAVAKTTDVDGVREDVEKVERKMEGVVNQVQANADQIASLRSTVSMLQNARTADKPVPERAIRDTPITQDLSFPPRRRRRSAFLAGAITKEQEAARLRKYERSRRSLRIWPIAGDTDKEVTEKLGAFFEGALQIPSERVKDMEIESVERIKQPQKMEVYNEIKVVFGNSKTRDWIASKGKCLAKYIDQAGKPTAGFRLDIPDFLAGDFKALEDYGFSMRSIHGKQTRRYVKYDEEEYSLYMELRLPGSPVWLRIIPELARELKQQNDREEIQQARKQLTARGPRITGSNIMTSFLPRGTKEKAFTVPQEPGGRDSETYEQMLERINNKLREESGQRKGRRGWTSGMDDFETVEPDEEDQEMRSETGQRTSRLKTSVNAASGGGPRHKDAEVLPPDAAFNLWSPEPRRTAANT